MKHPANSRGSDGPPRIEAISRAMQLLSALADFGAEGAGLAELSEITEISKPTAYRALTTMRSEGFVSQNAAGGYLLGPESLRLTDRYYSKDNLQTTMRPVLTELSKRTEELVHLGTWDGDEIVYLDKVEPTSRAIRVWSSVGQRVPAASSSLGRALLGAGNFEEEQLEHFIKILPSDRRVSRTRLIEAVMETRQTGFSSEIEENEPGVACIGIPLLRGDVPVAALSITSLATRMTSARQNQLKEMLRRDLPRLLPGGVTMYHPDGDS